MGECGKEVYMNREIDREREGHRMTSMEARTKLSVVVTRSNSFSAVYDKLMLEVRRRT